LHDANQLRRIVAAAELSRSDKVLEIGPGLGPLTELLLDTAGEVLAIEKDARLVALLNKSLSSSSPAMEKHEGIPAQSPGLRGTSYPGDSSRDAPTPKGLRPQRSSIPFSADKEHRVLTLLHDDALNFLKREKRDWGEWKMVSNLPYSVASPIVVELAQSERGPERMVVTLQIEVARRLMAAPDDKEYGLLTLLVQLNYEPRRSFKIPASCFFPEPDVDSACVCLVRRPPTVLSAAQKTIFVKVVKRSFSQRRKMMMKLLKEDWPAEKLARAFEALKIPEQTRAESVSVQQFVQLTRLLAEGGA